MWTRWLDATCAEVWVWIFHCHLVCVWISPPRVPRVQCCLFAVTYSLTPRACSHCTSECMHTWVNACFSCNSLVIHYLQHCFQFYICVFEYLCMWVLVSKSFGYQCALSVGMAPAGITATKSVTDGYWVNICVLIKHQQCQFTLFDLSSCLW